MRKSYYIYRKPECNIKVNKLPIWFEEAELIGDETKGTIIFNSVNDYDEYWGPNAKMEIDWFRKERTKFFFPREFQGNLALYNAIDVIVTKKKQDWLNSHEYSYWFGRRNKMIRRKYYHENCIHGFLYCDMTERVINLHTIVIQEHYKGFEPYLLAAYKSIVCH